MGKWDFGRIVDDTRMEARKSSEVHGRGKLLGGNRYRTLRDRMIYFREKIDLLGESSSWICNSLGLVISFHERV